MTSANQKPSRQTEGVVGVGSGDLLGHMVNLYNMIGMKLNSHPAANLVCAKRVII